MDYKEKKEIMDLVKHIQDINHEIINPTKNMKTVIVDTRKDIQMQSEMYEMACVNMDRSKLTSIDNIDENILYKKLFDYKILCQAELVKKCGQELYEEIKHKENLD